MSDEWPKRWEKIEGKDRPNTNEDYWAVGSELHAGVIRTHDGTVYINYGAGYESDKNKDEWLPIGVFIRKEVQFEVTVNE